MNKALARTRRAENLFFILPLLAVAMLAISGSSFWIDECYSALYAQQPTLASLWTLLQEFKGSDPQMPAYLLWIWCCEKITGSGELALRAVNLLWFIPALAVLARAFSANRLLQRTVFLAAVFSPFAWYYLNEARTYTMQFSTSLILFALVCHWTRNPGLPAEAERGRVYLFCVALFCLCGSSLLSMILALTPLLLATTLLPRERLVAFWKTSWPALVGTLLGLFLLGLYYLWTLHSGARATDIATTKWQNILFIGYELSGFAGLGPGRLEIRGGGMDVFLQYSAQLVVYAALVAALAMLALRELHGRFGSKKMLLIILAVCLPSALVVAASAFAHFRIVGRHLSVLLPIAVILLGFGMALSWPRGTAWRVVTVCFLGFYLTSALQLRFAARHEKDDYRGAVAFAKAALAKGKTVLWNADANAAAYYHLPLSERGAAETGKALLVINPTTDNLAAAGKADVIITSRRDVFDAFGTVAEFLAHEAFLRETNLAAFTIWKRAPAADR